MNKLCLACHEETLEQRMGYDTSKIDEAALALLGAYAQSEHGRAWAWKSLEFEISDRLFEKGLIEDPRNKNKSVYFTSAGIEAARAAADKLFGGNK
jgi:hypothetical protein